jgi:hypothetical protein
MRFHISLASTKRHVHQCPHVIAAGSTVYNANTTQCYLSLSPPPTPVSDTTQSALLYYSLIPDGETKFHTHIK